MQILTNKTIIILAIGLFAGIGISSFSIFLTEQVVQAQPSVQQVDPEDQRIFQLSRDFLNTIDQSFYTNGNPVMASSNGLPEVIITNWSQIRVADKAAINAVATSDDWTDVTCILKVCI